MLHDPVIFPYVDDVDWFLENLYWFTKVTDEQTGETWEVAYKHKLNGWFKDGTPFEDDVHINARKKSMKELYDFYLSNSGSELADKAYNDWAYDDGMTFKEAYDIVLDYLGYSYTHPHSHGYVKDYLEHNPDLNEWLLFKRVALIAAKNSNYVNPDKG